MPRYQHQQHQHDRVSESDPLLINTWSSPSDQFSNSNMNQEEDEDEIYTVSVDPETPHHSQINNSIEEDREELVRNRDYNSTYNNDIESKRNSSLKKSNSKPNQQKTPASLDLKFFKQLFILIKLSSFPENKPFKIEDHKSQNNNSSPFSVSSVNQKQNKLYPSIFLRINGIFWIFLLFILCVATIYIGNEVGKIPSKFYELIVHHVSNEPAKQSFSSLIITSSLWILSIVVGNSIQTMLSEILALNLRLRLTKKLQNNYLSNNKFYHILAFPEDSKEFIDNPDQRITRDVDTFTTTLSGMLSVVFTAPLSIVYYSYLVFKNLTWHAPVSCYAYFVIGSIVNKVIISRVAKFVFRQNALEGDFRYNHVYIRNNAEAIAFYGGQKRESETSEQTLFRAVKNKGKLVGMRFILFLHQNLFSYSSSILNYMVIALVVLALGKFSKLDAGAAASKISLTSFQMLSLIYGFSQFIELGSQLSDLAGYTARIFQLWDHVHDSSNRNDNNNNNSEFFNDEDHILNDQNSIRFSNVSCFTPTQDLLIDSVSFEVSSPEESLLITGPSGCGKSSLLRILCNLWPYHSGTVSKPSSGVFYLPQQPYMILGSFRDQITYPYPADIVTDDTIYDLLIFVGLQYLINRIGLDTVADYSDILSPGEKQRVSFARLFFHRPTFAVLDEATSALDPETESTLYQNCIEKDIILISVGHRSSLMQFHKRLLEFKSDGSWNLKQDC